MFLKKVKCMLLTQAMRKLFRYILILQHTCAINNDHLLLQLTFMIPNFVLMEEDEDLNL